MRALILNRAAPMAIIIAAAALASCHPASTTSNDTAVTLSNSAQPALPATVASAAAEPAGPEMLSTVGSYDGGPPLTRVAARQGTFAIQNVDGVDTLTLNGK